MSGREIWRKLVAALMHGFIRDLLLGYETILGGSVGVRLSGGQERTFVDC